jgi:hypothetical protein
MAEDTLVAIPEAITDVDFRTVQPAAVRRLKVTFKEGVAPAYLDPSERRSRAIVDLVHALAVINHPVSAELSRERFITQARMPSVGRVLGITEARQGDFAVRLDNFASVLLTERDSKFVGLLNESLTARRLVAVTSGATNQRITSVVPAGPVVDVCHPVATQPSAAAIVAGLAPVARQRLDDFVRDLVQDRCTLPAPAYGCHAFSFAANYCWVHTEVICHLLRDHGISVAKIWIFPKDQNAGGVLKAATRNLPTCEASWDFHVGALVKSDDQSLRVIDPILFPCATVSKRTWVDAMRVPNPTTRLTDTTVYKISSVDDPGGNLCPNIFDAELHGSVCELIATLNTVEGPPPYAACAVDPCGQPLS